MEDIREEGEQPQVNIPQSNPKPFKAPITNIRYNNKMIYQSYLQKDFKKCLALIGPTNKNSVNNNQFQLYINACIQRDQLNIQKSLQLFKQCHIMDKLNYDYLKNISKSMYLLGKFKSSLEAGNQALKIIKKDEQICYIFGKVYLALNQRQNSIKWFEEAIKINSSNQQSYLQLAKIYIQSNQYLKSYQILKEAIKYSPQNPDIASSLGILALKLGKKDQSQLFFDNTLNIDSLNYQALLGSGYLLQQKKQIDQTIMKYKLALSKSPNSPFLWNNIGMCFLQKKKLIAAYSCLKKAIYLDAFQWMIYANLGLVCIQMQKFVSAFVNLNIALTMKPQDPYLLMQLGIALTNLTDYGNAERAFLESINLQKKSTTYLNYCVMLVKKGDYKKCGEYIDLINESGGNKEILKNLRSILNSV